MNEIFTTYLDRIENSLRLSLPEHTNKDWQSSSFGNLQSCVKDEHILNLITPCRSLMDLGGKRWRPLMMVLVFYMARENGISSEIKDDDIFSLTPLVEFVHTASLIHDDIEDGATVRRGESCSHIKYGTDTAINAATWFYFLAPAVIDRLNISSSFRLKLYELYTMELRRLHLGQAMDIYWHRNPSLFPTIEEYTQMVHCKTGTLASLSCKSGFLASGATSDIIEESGVLAASLGEGFQILDDVQNLTTGNPGKKRGDDIVEGKKSLPVLLHIAKNPEDKEKLASLFKKASCEGIDSPSIEECIHLLSSSGSIEEAFNRGNLCIEQNIKKLVTLLGENKTKSSLLLEELFNSLIKKVQK